MPALKQNITVEIVRNIKASLNLKASITRDGAIPGPRVSVSVDAGITRDGAVPGPRVADLARRALAKLRAKQPVTGRQARRPAIGGAGADAGGVRPENIVWMFGSGRSGSTWLSSMMGDISGYSLWGEPWVGALFGDYYYRSVDERKHKARFFIMGRHREAWIESIRTFVLNGANAVFPGLKEDEYMIIKEPNGSIGAPLMMEALPESRMVLLVRDPRDVVASAMDARSKGGWNYQRNKKLYEEGRKKSSDDDRDAFARGRAKRYLEGMGKAKEAYDAHQGYKVIVKYEELRVDTVGTMKRMYDTLGLPVDEAELARVVEKHSWENIPEEERGQGKFYRKATPGGWREDLTPEQAQAVAEITAPLLNELYPEEVAAS